MPTDGQQVSETAKCKWCDRPVQLFANGWARRSEEGQPLYMCPKNINADSPYFGCHQVEGDTTYVQCGQCGNGIHRPLPAGPWLSNINGESWCKPAIPLSCTGFHIPIGEPVAVPPAPPVTCECCGRTKADHVRYSNFGDIPFCGHPAYGLRVFTEPPAPPEIPADLKADYRDCVNWHNGSYIKGLIERIAALEGKRA